MVGVGVIQIWLKYFVPSKNRVATLVGKTRKSSIFHFGLEKLENLLDLIKVLARKA